MKKLEENCEENVQETTEKCFKYPRNNSKYYKMIYIVNSINDIGPNISIVHSTRELVSRNNIFSSIKFIFVAYSSNTPWSPPNT